MWETSFKNSTLTIYVKCGLSHYEPIFSTGEGLLGIGFSFNKKILLVRKEAKLNLDWPGTMEKK